MPAFGRSVNFNCADRPSGGARRPSSAGSHGASSGLWEHLHSIIEPSEKHLHNLALPWERCQSDRGGGKGEP